MWYLYTLGLIMLIVQCAGAMVTALRAEKGQRFLQRLVLHGLPLHYEARIHVSRGKALFKHTHRKLASYFHSPHSNTTQPRVRSIPALLSAVFSVGSTCGEERTELDGGGCHRDAHVPTHQLLHSSSCGVCFAVRGEGAFFYSSTTRQK